MNILIAFVVLSLMSSCSVSGDAGGDLALPSLAPETQTPAVNVAELIFNNPAMPSGVSVNETSDVTLTLSNIGLASAINLSFGVLNAPFSIQSNNCALQLTNSGTCQIVVRYAPTAYSLLPHTSSLSVTYSGGNTTSTLVNLSGQSAAASLAFDNPAMPNNVSVNSTSDITLTLTNSGVGNASNLSFNSLSAPFSIQSNNCAATLLAGAQCQVVVRYAPTVYNAAADTSALSVTYDGASVASADRNLSGQSLEAVSAFTISGITGSADATNDAYLNGGLNPSVSWAASNYASSYDVTIYENNGTTVKCALVNVTVQTYDFTTCNLTAGTTYKAKVTAKNAGSSLDASNSPYSFRVNRAPVANTDTLTIMYNGSAVSVDPRANDTDADSDTLTISAKTNGTYGTVAIDAGSSTLTYTPNGTTYGSDSFTYTISDGAGATATATVNVKLMTVYTWIGAGANTNWGTSGNWCASIASPGLSGVCAGGAGPTATGTASHIAVFNSLCGASCNVTLAANAAAYKIEMQSSYAGTFTQTAGFTISVGAGGWSMAGGTFSGSSTNTAANNISVVGPLAISGGSFTSTRASLNLNPPVGGGSTPLSIAQTSYFIHNNGTVLMTNQSPDCTADDYTLDAATGTQFYNLSMAQSGNGCANSSITLPAGRVINVSNNYSLLATYVTFKGGQIDLSGNYTFTTVASGSTGTVRFMGTGAQTYSTGATTKVLGPNIIIEKDSGGVTPADTNNLGAQTFYLKKGSFTSTDGGFYIGNPAPANDTIFKAEAGATFNAGSGTVFLSASINSCSATTHTIDVPDNFILGNLTMNSQAGGCGAPVNFVVANSANLVVSGNFTPEVLAYVYVGAWNFKKNFTQTNTNGGAATLSFIGPNAQSYTYTAGTLPSGDIVVNKTGGSSLTLLTNMTANGAGQDLHVMAGTLDMNGKNLTVAGTCTVDVGAFITKGGGTLTCTGGIINNGTIN